MQGKTVELLAPAGSWEALEAVIEAGADAVYCSEKRFAMRQHGAWLNFLPEELPEVVAYAHDRGVACHLAMNNLLTSTEISLLKDALMQVAEAGPDALIIQDFGLLPVIADLGITLPIHASTMMNIHNTPTALALKAHGVTRFIASRDITVQQAARIARESGLDMEYFLHGDMCVAQGGQCTHSGIAAGYSANRGKCLKSCRWQWSLLDRDLGRVVGHVAEEYLLARKDLSLYHQLPRLLELGVASLKIEGRARPGAYLAPIVAAYREALDRYQADPAGYVTDFAAQRTLTRHTLREVGTSHALGRPGVGSSGLSGEREPRFFSIAVEEAPYGRQSLVARHDPLPGPPPKLMVRCGSPAAARAVLATPAEILLLGGERFMGTVNLGFSRRELATLIDAAHAVDKAVIVATPRTSGPRELLEIKRLVDDLSPTPPDGWMAGNLGSLSHLSRVSDRPIHGDFSLNTWNPQAARFLARMGAASLTPGLELNLEHLLALSRESPLPLTVLVHGSLPGMILDYCPIGVHLTGTTCDDACPGPCAGRAFALENPLGLRHWLEADQHCRNHLFMVNDLCSVDFAPAMSGGRIAHWRIEGIFYQPDHLVDLVTLYHQARGNTVDGTLLARVIGEAPRPLGTGAYGNELESVSTPCQELPTDLLIRYPKNA